MVPVLVQTPPTACFSTNATLFPALTAWIAARWPPGPEPITISSYGCIRCFLGVGFVRWAFGAGLDVVHSISKQGRSELRYARRVTVDARGQVHQMFLHGETMPVANRAR